MPWRSLTYVQEHVGKGITSFGERRMPGRGNALIGDVRDAETSEHRLEQRAGPT